MAAKRVRVKWQVGCLFGVPLLDGRLAVGQILGVEAQALNSVSIGLWSVAIRPGEGVDVERLVLDELFASLLATKDLLDTGGWPLLGSAAVQVPRTLFPCEELRQTGFVGAKIYGAGIVQEFVNAYFLLVPWDDWKDPAYLDRLLLSPAKRPHSVLLKSRAGST